MRSIVAASPSRVWRALTKELAAWWGPPYTQPLARKVVLEPRLGGRLFEEHGPGAGVLWGLVTELHPARSLTIEGSLGVSGATAGELHLQLKKVDDGRQTSVHARVAITGEVSEGDRAAVLHQWEASLGERLPRWIEQGEAGGLARGDFNAPLQDAAGGES